MYDNRTKVPAKNIFGYLFLCLVIASGASFVPLGVSLNVSNSMTKVSWRVVNMIPFLAIAGFFQARLAPNFRMMQAFERKNMINIIIAGLAISGQQYCAIFAGQYTLMSHSVIFVNLSGPVMVGYRMFRKQFVHKLEILGCSVAIFGAFLSILDQSAEKVNPEEQNILLGDSVALIGSFLCAIWMMKNEEIVSKMPPLYAMSLIMIVSEIILLVIGCICFADFTLDRDPTTGAFGFLNDGLWLYVILVYGFFTGACN